MSIQNNWNDQKSLPADLLLAKEQIYDVCGLACSLPQPEAESAEYDAFDFTINQHQIKFRSAKITPTKTGQFVTLWKRNKLGTIEPFDFSDSIDFVIVNVRKKEAAGQFVFPKAVLLSKGVFSTASKEGKRATRVYPPWDETTSKQAQKTQQWQLDYFHELSPKPDLVKYKTLFQI
ncbi:hypothetical protein B4N84_13155 [Flavobacterium sp. IR1]|nr:hypothetical protein B4N84_13155 [Flavobacterium sp. IR1]